MEALVVGQGKSGRSAYDYLYKHNYNVKFADEKILNLSKEDFEKQDKDRLFEGLSFIVTSPGVSLDLPFLVEAKKRKIKIVGELELGAKNLKGDIIAVTGTNGKTTTVSIINYLLKNQERRVFLGGNIGVPVTSFCDNLSDGDIAVLECSSYQLESVKDFHAHIACILNFSVDHLARHKTLKKYIWCKNRITRNQTENDYLLINYDNSLLMKNSPKTKAKIFYFSTKSQVDGCYLSRGCIYFKDNKTHEKLLSLKHLKLVGEHNISNVLASVLAVYLQTRRKDILQDVVNFNSVEHRIEYVKTINGVAFYNDSKATNIDSTIVATKSFKCEINLILGGSDKGYDFDELFKNLPKNVKNIAIFGETKHKIAFSAKKFGFDSYQIYNTLKESVLSLFRVAHKNSIVLLSPACASFDYFSNFEERGNVFKKIVGEIALDENLHLENSKKS